MADEAKAPQVYAGYVEGLLAKETEYASAIQGRATAVITVSAALVTLLLSLAALASGKDRAAVPPSARPWIDAALAAFLLAACLAIGTYSPGRNVVADPEGIAEVLRRRWSDSEAIALAKVTADRLAWLQRLQGTNDVRARILLGAVVVQVGAVVCLGVAVILTL